MGGSRTGVGTTRFEDKVAFITGAGVLNISSIAGHMSATPYGVSRLAVNCDIVNAMTYLCSEEASYITGETLSVSGGFPLQL